MAVVEGYTDVIAAHQVGLCNVVGTLGTALGDDHVTALRRLADRSVLVFDGDEAGQKAADRSLELFLGHEVDVRVLTLPEDLDPCDFLLTEGADAFRAMVDRAVDPLDLRDRPGLGSVRLRLGRGVEAGGRVGPGDPGPGPESGPARGSTSRWPRRSTRSRRKLSVPVADLKRRLGELRNGRTARPGRLSRSIGGRGPGPGRPRRSGPRTSTRSTANSSRSS